MTTQLRIRFGQCSERGHKPLNQDFHGLVIPETPLLSSKGIAVALADGISSSDVSQIASETAVKGFLEDYYATPESWSVKTSVQRVLQATSSWLHAQTRNGPHRYAMDRGYVCTFSALVLKSTTLHLFHIGDSRIYYVAANRLEPLTEDHRLFVAPGKSYLARALGMRERLEIDHQSYPLETGDTFLLMTDGVYEHARESVITALLGQHADDLDRAARLIVAEALEQGSTDNLTLQILRVEQLPAPDVHELSRQATHLPFPPPLHPRMDFDGYQIVREIHASSRSHVYEAIDTDSGETVVLKAPSMDLREDAAYIERFLMEEWIARRVDHVNLLRACEPRRRRNYLYSVTERIEGKTLTQWMVEHPTPELDAVRRIVEQIAAGLQALHRQEVLHQDLRPENILIDGAGRVKIIDFGSVRVAGIAEILPVMDRQHILGTPPYTAPESFLGEPGTPRSDLFALGVISYQMLSGRLPYGTQVARATTRAAQRKLVYRSALDAGRPIPVWIDGALRKAVHPNPDKRYQELSEFVYDLRHPNPAFTGPDCAPLLERNPLLFWKGLSLILFAIVLLLLGTHPVINR